MYGMLLMVLLDLMWSWSITNR